MAASLQGDSSLSADRSLVAHLDAPLVGTSHLGATMKVTNPMAAALAGTSSLGATIHLGPKQMAASLTGTSTLAAHMSVAYQMRAVLLGTSVAGATPEATYRMKAALTGTSTLGATPSVVVGPAVPIHELDTRVVPTQQTIFNQVDFFQGDGKTRQQGLIPSNLTLKLCVGATDAAWPLVSGVGVPDIAISSGKVYFTEFEAGYYSFRFYPNMVGLWRIVLLWASGNQGVSQSFDVRPATPFSGGLGLRSSFMKPRGTR